MASFSTVYCAVVCIWSPSVLDGAASLHGVLGWWPSLLSAVALDFWVYPLDFFTDLADKR